MTTKTMFGRIGALCFIITCCAVLFSCPVPKPKREERKAVRVAADSGTIALWHRGDATGRNVGNGSGDGRDLFPGNDGTADAYYRRN